MRRGLLLALCLALAGCDSGGGSKPPVVHKLPPGPTIRLGLVTQPRTLDPALASDLPSVNVVRQLFAGLTRIEGSRAVPDLASSWKLSEGGRVWTFHLRDRIGWSDGRKITASDFRDAWLHALAPETHSAYARAEMLNIAGARAYRADSGSRDDVGIEAVDDRTLRVTLRHPVPWLDQQVAYPVFFPSREGVSSGPFHLEGRLPDGGLVLVRNPRYWDAEHVRPGRVELGSHAPDGVLPTATLGPGFPWVDTVSEVSVLGRSLPTLSVQYLWFATKHPPLDDVGLRRGMSAAIQRTELVGAPLTTVAPPSLEGKVPPFEWSGYFVKPGRTLTLAFTTQDPHAKTVATAIGVAFAQLGARVRLVPLSTRAALLARVGPPISPGIDLALLGWSGEFFDAYNFFDQFTCASGLNVAGWCDPTFDALMTQAVRTLDNGARRALERRLEAKLTGPDGAFPAAPLYTVTDRVLLRSGLTGFGYSALGFWDLRGLH